MNKLFRSCLSAFAVLLLAYLPASAVGFDLAVSISTSNPNPAIYTDVPITVTATNTGTTTGTGIEIHLLQCGGNIGGFVQGTGLVYASTGTASLGTWDFVSQRWTIPSLAAGQTATLNFTLFALTTDPRSVNVFTQSANTPDVDSSPGNLPIVNGNWVCTDNEDDEDVLTLNGASGPQPDMNLSSFLAVQNNGQAGSSVITPGAQVAAGTPISFVDHLAYLTFPQPVPSFNSVIAAYLSTDATLSANDVLLTSTALTINANVQSYGFTEGPFGNGTIASNTTPGSYFIIVKYDATDLLAESDEANNFKTLPIVVTGGNPLPDLSGILHEFIPGNVCYTAPGQSFGFISMQINNMGTAAATAFKVKFYFSTDNVLSANDVLWVTENVPSLGLFSNGGPAFVSPTQPVPASLPMGQYYVIVTIDGDNQVAESNESNNTITPFTVQIGAADVTMQGVAGVPASAPAGSSFTVQVTAKYVSNGFSFPAGTGFPVDVVVTDVSPFQTVGTVNFNLSEFASSNTVTKSVQVNVPATLAVGAHNFRFAANPAFCEPKGPSNWQDKSITVTAGGSGIDLELAMLQNTANPVIYSNYTTTLTLVNKGPQAATGVKVKWAKPAGVVYTGGNEFTASQGSFNPNGDQVWTVGNVPANGSATLTVRYFLLQNGAPITYAQVTAANETDVDSQPNNGTPPTPNQDDEANSGGSQPPVLTPDLTISNLVITNSPVQPGQVLTYNFDLANIGNGNAPGDFKVKAYISTQGYFDPNGFQDGVVPTGNFNAGFSVSGVPGSSTIPTNLNTGQYYLHLWVDADAQVSEVNESNNYATAPFVIQANQQPGQCDDLVGPGHMACVANNSAGNLEICYLDDNNGQSLAVLDGMGDIASNQSLGTVFYSDNYRIESNTLKKYHNVATLVYTKPIPAALLSQYDGFYNFTEYNGGYILFALKNGSTYAIRTDAALVVQQAGPINLQVAAGNGFGIYNVLQVSPTEVAFLYFSQSNNYPQGKLYLAVLNGSSLSLLSNKLLASDYFSGGGSFFNNPCGGYTVYVNTMLYFCVHGSCYANRVEQGHFANGEWVVDNSYSEAEVSTYGQGHRNHSWTLRTSDGGNILGTMDQQLPINPNPPNNIIHLEKTLNGLVVWTKDVTVASAAAVRRLGYTGNELVFLSEKNNAVFVEALSCLETPAPPTGCAAINITAGANSLTIAGATAPHVLIKVFNPNWTLKSQCLDNCANPLTLNNLSAGVYHLQVKLLDAGWGEICYLEQDVSVNGFGAGGSTSLAQKDNRYALVLDKFYPNPSSYEVTVDVFSPVEQAATLDFYDQMGRAVHTMQVQLDKGKNAIPVLVFDWKSGAYNVIARGEQTQLPAYGKFLKVWEE